MSGLRSNDQYRKSGYIGDNGTGKSTHLLEKVIKPAYNLLENRILILSDTTPRAYSRITRLKTYDELRAIESGIFLFWDYEIDTEQMLENIINILREGQQNREAGKPHADWYLHNGAIVFDDCSNYILPTPKKIIRTFLGNHRMYYIDLFFIAHTLTDFPSFLRRRMNYFTVFKTLETLQENDLKSLKYPNHENLYRAWVQVMNHQNRHYNLTIKTGI